MTGVTDEIVEGAKPSATGRNAVARAPAREIAGSATGRNAVARTETREFAGSAAGGNAITRTAPGGEGLHYIMGYIAALWPNFAAGRTPDQKRAMIAVWERALDDIPIKLQKAALDKKVRAGQLYPPSSPAELRTWCDEVQPPMQSWQVKWYADMAELGFFDPEFCRRQIEKFEAGEKAGRNVYVGWE